MLANDDMDRNASDSELMCNCFEKIHVIITVNKEDIVVSSLSFRN